MNVEFSVPVFPFVLELDITKPSRTAEAQPARIACGKHVYIERQNVH